MMQRRVTTIIILCITLVSVMVFAVTLIRAGFSPESDGEITVPIASTTPDTQIISAEALIPDRLRIPKISVDTHVQSVGISKHNTMAVPTNYTDVGWYRYGAKPGEMGNAVFAGHLDNGFGKDAVFKNLKTLKLDDDIYVRDINNKELHFKVTGFDTYDKNATSTQNIFKKTGPAGIVLITCEGEWNADQKMYAQRLIVTGKLVAN